MAISLRLARGGSKKRPYYKIVATDSRSPRDGKYLEQIGTYNPLLAKDDENRIRLTEDRARYWLGVGGQPTDRVARLLDKMGVRERVATNNPNKAEPGKKAKERAEDRATKAAEAEEAAAAAAAAPVVEEAPVEEAAVEDTAAADANEATPNSDAGDDAAAASGESAQEPAEG